jgi:hypothetical protein
MRFNRAKILYPLRALSSDAFYALLRRDGAFETLSIKVMVDNVASDNAQVRPTFGSCERVDILLLRLKIEIAVNRADGSVSAKYKAPDPQPDLRYFIQASVG